jgi:hypothetical protein
LILEVKIVNLTLEQPRTTKMTQILRFTNQQLTDQEIEKHLHKELLTVDLQNCEHLTDQTLAQLALKTSMYSLRWVSNPNATSAGHLFLATNATLKALNVSGSEQFKDDACSKHLQSPTLQYLDASFCSNLTDQAFSCISAPLMFLNLQGCTQITDQTIHTLLSLETLKHLYLAFNDKITKTAINLLKNHPLDTLKIYPLDI